MAGFVRVLWPFAAGLVIGWIGAGLYRAPMAFRRAVAAWIITVFVGVALRIVVQGHDFTPTFIVIASLFIGGCMLGWRAVVVRVSRRRARRALSGDALRRDATCTWRPIRTRHDRGDEDRDAGGDGRLRVGAGRQHVHRAGREHEVGEQVHRVPCVCCATSGCATVT